MANDIDLVEYFGDDYYSIGLFSSVSKYNIDSLPIYIVGLISDLCFQIKYEYYAEAAAIIETNIIATFIQCNSLDKLVAAYKPYDHLIAVNEYYVDNYIVFSEKLLDTVGKLNKLQPDTIDLIIEIFNMINMYRVHTVISNMK